jgi:L-rhamnonate dehydratase
MTTIRAVRCFQISGHDPGFLSPEERQAQMLDIHPEFAARGPATASDRVEAIYVEIATDDGASGIFGPIFAETVAIIKERLARHLIGRDPLAGEFLWDVLYRQDRHARKGNQMIAISALDNALWDLRGKLLGQPVYRLLGGPTRASVPCYASMLGHSLDPGLIRERARAMVEAGYTAQKWFFRYGPSDGLAGMERNVAMVRAVREAVGPEIEIMLDAFMGWDATYTVRMLERIAEFRPRWMEEPVPPDRINDFAMIRRATSIPIATGEHEYTRWGFLALLQAEAVDVIQADPDWCGGISEVVKIGVLASAFGRQVVPHGHSIHAAVNVIASQPPATFPMAEYLLRNQPGKQYFHTEIMRPERGVIALPTAPGLGFTIDDAKVEERIELM